MIDSQFDYIPHPVKENHLDLALNRPQTHPETKGTMGIKRYHRERWKEEWTAYRGHNGARSVPTRPLFPTRKTTDMRVGLQKAESPLAMQIRTEKIGLRAFLS